ncbi:MAG: MFS transporter [Desulfobacterales bacterium]|nr:MAG: MFS transporter [Desulfobacterales bacterium]
MAGPKRGIVLAACCLAVFWPGAFIFGFPGVLSQHWQLTFSVGKAAVGQSIFFILAGAGTFMYAVGRWQSTIGSSRMAAFGALMCGGSVIFLGHVSSIIGVYLWAFLVGSSSAFLYIPALTVAQGWFPKSRGLASGLVNMSFGLSAAIMSPVFTQLLIRFGYGALTLICGLLALIIGLLDFRFVRFPGHAAIPEEALQNQATAQPPSLKLSRSLRTSAFWLLWLTYATAGAAGVAMLALATAFGLAKGLPIQTAVLVLTAFNLTNGVGRLISGFLSDLVGRNATMTFTFLAAGAAELLFPHTNSLAIWLVLSATIGFAFGTLFAVSAPLAVDCFGIHHFGAIFGLVFTAYAFVAGPLGPWLSGLLLDRTGGNFALVFGYLGLCYFAAAVLIWFVRPPGKLPKTPVLI